MKNLGGVIVSLVMLFTVSVVEVWADGAPTFPSCAGEDDKGDYKSESGSFRVPGQAGNVSGQSEIYYRGLGSYYQCICQNTGSGIQVNFWNIKGKEESLINPYILDGWWRINGSDYGLRSDPYVAKVSPYTCNASSPATPTPSQIISPTPTIAPNLDSPTPTLMIGSSSTTSQAIGGLINGSSPSVCTNSKPEVPMLLVISKVGTDKVKMEWTKVDSATHYVIEYGHEVDNYIYGVPNTGNQTSFEIGSLDLNKRYYFRVRAVADCMPGDPSNVLSYPQALGQVLGLAQTSSIDWKIVFLGVSGVAVMGLVVLKRI